MLEEPYWVWMDIFMTVAIREPVGCNIYKNNKKESRVLSFFLLEIMVKYPESLKNY